MRDLPEALDEADLINALAEGWGLEVAGAEYLPVGGGSYHWAMANAGGGRHFITVDDLDGKGYLGATRDLVFEGLRGAFGAALALRDVGGLDFVIAPQLTRAGEAVRRIDSRYTAAVFPFIDGTSRGFFGSPPPEERAELVRMLVKLHQATPLAEPIARPVKVLLPGRGDLETALQDLDREWTGGPFSEAARALLAHHRDGVLQSLEVLDRLAGQVAASDAKLVITHGEPHPGNVVHTGGRLVLIDWDTVGLAPPERDLWLVDSGRGAELELYADVSGRQVDTEAVALYRLRWKLDDIASFVNELRSPHCQTADTEHASRSFARALSAV